MGSILDAFKNAFRLYEIDGLPASGAHKPAKADAIALGGILEDPSNLGIVNVAGEVTIDDTLTIPTTFPAAYLVTDKASPADYNIFLPGGADDGSLVYFRIDAEATKLFTLYDSGTDMEGDDRILLQAAESIMLLKVGGFWKRVGGVKVPICGKLRRTASLSLTTATPAAVVWQAALGNARGYTYGLPSLNTFRAPRAGHYRITVNLSTTGSAAAQESRLQIINDAPIAGVTDPAQIISCQYGFTGSPRLTHCLSGVFAVSRTGTVTVTVTVTGTSPAVEYAGGSIEAQLHFEEIIL